MKLTTSPCKKESVTETPPRNLQPIGYQGSSKPRQAGMTSGSESQPEDAAVKLGSLCTKTRIGFWNVRTMFSTGRLAQVTKEMDDNKLHILGISECR